MSMTVDYWQSLSAE